MTELDAETVLISLTGVELHTHHGVSDAEQELGQRMLFDVEMAVKAADAGATETDEIDSTVDYGEVTSTLAGVATENRYRTLERLVTVIAESLLAQFPVEQVRVRATKPEPPVPVTMTGASVEILRRRDD